MEIKRRPATDDDYAFAREAHHAGYYPTVIKQFGKWDEAEQDRRFHQSWRERSYDILLHDDRPCGYCAIETTDDCVYLVEFVIHPEFRGQGIGTAAFHQIADSAGARGQILHFQVLRENSALDFYHKQGAEIIGHTDSHILMRLRSGRIATDRS